MNIEVHDGYRYFLTFTDDLSRYGYIYFMKHKSKTFEKFKEFQSEVENHRNKKINFLRSDRGGEYFSCDFGLHAPLMNGLFFLNLDRSDTHIHYIDAKDAKLIMIVQLICATAV